MSLRETKNAPFSTKSKKCENFAKKNLFSRKMRKFCETIWLETLMRCMEGMRAVKLNLLEEYWMHTPALIFINCLWIIIRCKIQGAPEYRDTGCIRIQWHRVHQDTGILGAPEHRDAVCTRMHGYRVYQNTGLLGAPGYRDALCTRIHGYGVNQNTRILIECIPGYRDTGCTRIQGYRV